MGKGVLLTELQKERAFVGQTEEERGALEEKIKEAYTISDWDVDGKKGYVIRDNAAEQDSYFSPNSRLTLETRYLEKNEDREVTENVLDLFARVAVNIAEADLKYDPEADIKPVAESFLELLVYKRFMPNTPTLCNAGRALQQLSACFVLPVEDYMATDDIGEDPEKQGHGIVDTLRYMSMIHKSGGGTGFNFSHLRPRSDAISTTFGSSSGPVSFMKTYDAMTEAVNQGGFRRGANMGILNHDHPDIFEFVGEKARNGTFANFNLSVGVTNEFMHMLETDGEFRLINPKGEIKGVPLEERVWKTKNLLRRSDENYDNLFNELRPSLVVSEDGSKVINVYTEQEVGRVDDAGVVLISARKLFDEITQNAWEEGCPGVIFLDRLEGNNKTPHMGRTEATNPCGEQPLLPFEACNLGAINLASCVRDREVDYQEIERRVDQGVHFLDNVIDMSKFPFQKIYGIVHGNRKVGLGLMGWAEMLVQLGIPYDSDEAVGLAREISSYVTKIGVKASEKLAETRGVFPNWEGSVWEEEGKRVRNATVTTIAPNGTTAMIADCTGGIEPFFKLAYTKTCMDGKKLHYSIPLFEKGLGGCADDQEELGRILGEVEKTGSIQDVEGVSDELKGLFKSSHDVSPEAHVKIQAAFQSGIHNAVSKTVNLPNRATTEDVERIYRMAYDEGCIGVTIFRDGSKTGVLSGLEKKIELLQVGVESPPFLDKKAQAVKYRVQRLQNRDSLHVTITSDLFVDDETSKAYFVPTEIFQMRVPLGHSTSVSFGQSGIDRTEIMKGPDPDYAEFIKRLQSAHSNEEEGLGPNRIKSIEHAVGIILEDCFLGNGIIKRDEGTNMLVNAVRKSELRRVEVDSDEYHTIMSQVRIVSGKEEVVTGNNGGIFLCEDCGSREPTFIAGCTHPVCKKCGWDDGSCG